LVIRSADSLMRRNSCNACLRSTEQVSGTLQQNELRWISFSV